MSMQTQDGMGRIVVLGYERYEDAGTPESSLTTTSFHVLEETTGLSRFLEIERASRRGIRFPPTAIGALIVMAPDASLLSVLREWWGARRVALTTRRKWQEWLTGRRAPECTGKDPRGCWNVRCQLGGTCCRATGVSAVHGGKPG
jgi:hypothetical protein